MTQPQTAWDGIAPLDWFRLIGDAEAFRARTGWDLANVWHHINTRDYHAARQRLDQMIADTASMHFGPSLRPHSRESLAEIERLWINAHRSIERTAR